MSLIHNEMMSGALDCGRLCKIEMYQRLEIVNLRMRLLVTFLYDIFTLHLYPKRTSEWKIGN